MKNLINLPRVPSAPPASTVPVTARFAMLGNQVRDVVRKLMYRSSTLTNRAVHFRENSTEIELRPRVLFDRRHPPPRPPFPLAQAARFTRKGTGGPYYGTQFRLEYGSQLILDSSAVQVLMLILGTPLGRT